MMHMRHYKIPPYRLTLATLAVAALAAWPVMPLGWAIFATGAVGPGVGTVFPVATCRSRTRSRHDVGTATGAMNFFRRERAVVAIMGAILLAGFGVTPERGAGVELTVANAGAAGVAVAEVFRLVFVAALVFSIMALVALVLLEERPLHGPAVEAPPVTPDATPAE